MVESCHFDDGFESEDIDEDSEEDVFLEDLSTKKLFCFYLRTITLKSA